MLAMQHRKNMFGLRSADGIPFPFHCCWGGQSQHPPQDQHRPLKPQCDPQHSNAGSTMSCLCTQKLMEL